MNICIITPRYPYKESAEFVFVKKIVDEWTRNGHRCIVISTFSLTAYARKRIQYRPFKYRDELGDRLFVDVYNPRYYSTGLSLGNVSLDYMSESRAIEKQIIRIGIKFDLFYCHFIGSALTVFKYAQRYNIPIFVATGESRIETLKKPYKNFKWKDFTQYTKGIVAVSSKNKEEASEKGYIDINKCQVFPNGTDISIFKPLDKEECRKNLHLPANAFIISCVGFICERKGQDRLLEAVRQLKNQNIRLIFIGTSAKIETFELEGEEILFKGPVANKDLPLYLCASNIFCLPTRAEGCCNAIIEAMACGLPIISSNLSFNWDVLDKNNSILVNPDNIEEISNAIMLLYNNSNKLNELSNSAYLKGKQLSISQRAISIMEFIEKRM